MGTPLSTVLSFSLLPMTTSSLPTMSNLKDISLFYGIVIALYIGIQLIAYVSSPRYAILFSCSFHNGCFVVLYSTLNFRSNADASMIHKCFKLSQSVQTIYYLATPPVSRNIPAVPRRVGAAACVSRCHTDDAREVPVGGLTRAYTCSPPPTSLSTCATRSSGRDLDEAPWMVRRQGSLQDRLRGKSQCTVVEDAHSPDCADFK